MAGGIDTSKRKPRQLRNTPALRYTTIASLGILTVCCLIETVFFFAPGSQNIHRFLVESDWAKRVNERQEAKRAIFQNFGASQKTSKGIRQDLEREKENQFKY